jgi:hypothetical protein
MEDFRQEIKAMFQQLTQEVMQTIQTHPAAQAPQDPDQFIHDDGTEEELSWPSILEDLPAAPLVSEAAWSKLFKLAKELKRRSLLMTAGRDLHDIHTVLYMAAHWPDLNQPAKNYLAHRMRLLYIAITKGWPAALYYDQQGTDEFSDISPES